MKQKLLLFLLFPLFVVPAFSYSVPDDTIVYTTTYGDHYHRSSCGHLHSSRHETTIANVVARGFIACSVCRPDIGSYTQAQEEDDQSEDWVDTGYGLLYNTWTEQVKTEDGVIYDDESEALEDMGYTYNSELDMWVGEDGIIQDGEFSPYQEFDGGEPEEEPEIVYKESSSKEDKDIKLSDLEGLLAFAPFLIAMFSAYLGRIKQRRIMREKKSKSALSQNSQSK